MRKINKNINERLDKKHISMVSNARRVPSDPRRRFESETPFPSQMGGVREFVPPVALFAKCKAAAAARDVAAAAAAAAAAEATATATRERKATKARKAKKAAKATVMAAAVAAAAAALAAASPWPMGSRRTGGLPTYRPLEPWQMLGAILALERSCPAPAETEASCRHCAMDHHSWMHQHLKLSSFPCPVERKLALLEARPKLPSQIETPMSRPRLRRMSRKRGIEKPNP
jgi:hypothetical protein